MSYLKRLFQFASAVVTIGLCLNPISTDALTLTLAGQLPITSTNKNCINFSSNQKMLKKLRESGKNCHSVLVQKVSNATVSGRLKSETDSTLINRSGAEIGGIVLTLTNFSISASSDINNINLLSFFDDDFPTPSSPFPFILAFQNLNGDFKDLTGNQVDTSDNITFDAFIDSPSSSRRRIIELQSQSDAIPPSPPRVVDINAIDENCGLRHSKDCSIADSTLKIIGQLNGFTLKAGEQLNLKNSACIVVVAADENKNPVDENGNLVSFDSQDAEENCRRIAIGIPEPSSILGILALGTLGATSLLTRKQKSIQRDKD